MRRFFFDPKLRTEDTVALPSDESRHISRVLRLPEGESIELLDGLGSVYTARIITTGKQVRARIISVAETGDGNEVPLVVGQGILKGKKMDTVIQKCTELGVTRFLPFHSERCQGKPGELREDKKHERYQRIVEAACKQCYRPDLMEMGRLTEFTLAIESFDITTRTLPLLFWEEEKEVSLHDVTIQENLDQAIVLLGPEGGFSAQEVEAARQLGWQTVSLGPRILRAETATLTAVSLVQYLLGNI